MCTSYLCEPRTFQIQRSEHSWHLINYLVNKLDNIDDNNFS